MLELSVIPSACVVMLGNGWLLNELDNAISEYTLHT